MSKKNDYSLLLLRKFHDKRRWNKILAVQIIPKVIYNPRKPVNNSNSVLAIAIARMLIDYHRFSYTIEGKILYLNKETSEDEITLFSKLEKVLAKWKPELIINYSQQWQGIPLLSLKYHHLKQSGVNLPNFYNMISGAIHIDIEPLLRQVIKRGDGSRFNMAYLPLNTAIYHHYFKGIAFSYNIELEKLTFAGKGKQLYNWWLDEKKDKLTNYLRREVNNQLLVTLQLCAEGFLEIFRRHSKLVYTSVQPEEKKVTKKKRFVYQTTIMDEVIKLRKKNQQKKNVEINSNTKGKL